MTLASFDNGDSDEARQFLLDRRVERLHPKRHRTTPRRRRHSAAKKARIKARVEHGKAARAKFLTAVQAYWAGQADGHP